MNFLTAVVVSLPCIAFFGGMCGTRVDFDRGHHPNVCSEGGRGSGARRYVGMGTAAMRVGSYSCPRHNRLRPIVSNRSQGSQHCVRSSLASEHYTLLLEGLRMEEVFHGSIWYTIAVLLAADDVVRLRVAASRWNKGERYGLIGRVFFNMLTLEQHREL